MLIYSQKSKFNFRDDLDLFNESAETLSIEILNKKSRNIVVTPTVLPKEITKYLRIFEKTF